MSDSEIQVINAQTEDNLTGLIIDGVPHLYWFALYKALDIYPDHAFRIISNLTKEKHYVSFSRSEIKEILSGTDVLSILPAVRNYHFLTEEGYNRAIMEISTGHMKNSSVAKAIDAKKDHIANIYTRYQQGETLSLTTEQHPAIPGEVTQPVNEVALAEAKLRYYNTAKKIAISMGADRRSTNIVMIEKIKEEFPDIHPFMAMIPDEKVSNNPDDAILTRQEVSGILKTDLQTLEERIVNVGWVTKSMYGWLLTPKGTKYLKQDPHIGEKRTWYDIRFGLDAIQLLKREFEQRLLTGGYLSSGSSRGVMPVSGKEKMKQRRMGCGF